MKDNRFFSAQGANLFSSRKVLRTRLQPNKTKQAIAFGENVNVIAALEELGIPVDEESTRPHVVEDRTPAYDFYQEQLTRVKRAPYAQCFRKRSAVKKMGRLAARKAEYFRVLRYLFSLRKAAEAVGGGSDHEASCGEKLRTGGTRTTKKRANILRAGDFQCRKPWPATIARKPDTFDRNVLSGSA